MNRSRRLWWTLYGTGSLVALAALGWISQVLLELEAEKQVAQRQADQASVIRLALWRMDSWLGPQLAREAARPYFEYAAFVPNERAYTRLLNRIEAGEVLSPSPLLSFDSELFPIHFQMDEVGAWSSPQVPTGNQLDLAQGSLVDDVTIANKGRLLATIRGAISPTDLRGQMGCVELGFNDWMDPWARPVVEGESKGAQDAAGKQELSKRVITNIASQNYSNNPNVRLQGTDDQGFPQIEPQLNGRLARGLSGTGISIGPLLPIWLPEDAMAGPLEICFVRRVEAGNRLLLQGFAGNWAILRASLIEQLDGLFDGAQVKLTRGEITDIENAASLLAAIPAQLEVEFPVASGGAVWTPARATLGITWFAALIGLAGLALSLHASITYAEKRSRFASSVTHELRTPLTTFRMYTEMLVNGMVRPEKQEEYLKTLQRESDRLSILVENVLTYARLEDGRAQLARAQVSVTELLERSGPVLLKRVVDCEGTLEVHDLTPEGTRLATDAGAVEQILFNLVDNACKYGGADSPPSIELTAQVEAADLLLTVRDQGPGVPEGLTATIFEAFDRGRVADADPRPGIGLGLALCRGLARDLGGELEYIPSSRAGACFGLRLPRS